METAAITDLDIAKHVATTATVRTVAKPPRDSSPILLLYSLCFIAYHYVQCGTGGTSEFWLFKFPGESIGWYYVFSHSIVESLVLAHN